MKEKIILIGGGGHCKVCIDLIEAEGRFRIAGIVDKKERIGTKVLAYKIFAADDDLPSLVKEYRNFLITVGHIKNAHTRKTLFMKLKDFNVNIPTIVSPHSYIPKYSDLGEGTVIRHGVYLDPEVKIGKNCIINMCAMIGHDSIIGDHSHISVGAIVTSGVHIGKGAFIGSNSVILNDVKIPEDTIIGAGSVVTKSIIEKGTYVGNPARRLHEKA